MNPRSAIRFLLAVISLAWFAARVPGTVSYDTFQDLNRSLSITGAALSRRRTRVPPAFAQRAKLHSAMSNHLRSRTRADVRPVRG
jgi:hypothetical protein